MQAFKSKSDSLRENWKMKRMTGLIALALMLAVCVGCENSGTTEKGGGGGNGTQGSDGGAEGGSGTGFVMPAAADIV